MSVAFIFKLCLFVGMFMGFSRFRRHFFILFGSLDFQAFVPQDLTKIFFISFSLYEFQPYDSRFGYRGFHYLLQSSQGILNFPRMPCMSYSLNLQQGMSKFIGQ